MKKALYALAQLGAAAPALAQNFSSDDRPITMSRDELADASVKSNWLPAPDGLFALIVPAYVPGEATLSNGYKLPNVEPAR